MLFTAQLGTDALASMGSISLILFFPKTFIYAVSYAVQIYTARDLGKGSHLNALISGLILCCIISLLSLCFLYTFEGQLLRRFLLQDTFSDDVRIYFRLQICSFFLASLILTLRGFFSAFNENSLFFYIVVMVVVCQLFFSFLFMSGHSYTPEYGLTGIGLAIVLAQLLGALGYIVALFIYKPFLYKSFRICYRSLTKMLHFIAPVILLGLFDHLGTVILFLKAKSMLGLTRFAVMHLVFSVLGCFPGMGFGLALMTPVSTSYGAKKYVQAYQSCLSYLVTGSFLIACFAAAISILMPWLLPIIVPEQTLAHTSLLPMQLMLAGIGLHVACQISLRSLQAIDQSVVSTVINLASVYFFRIPFLYALHLFTHVDIHHIFLLLLAEKMLKVIWMQKHLFFYLRFLQQKTLSKPITL